MDGSKIVCGASRTARYATHTVYATFSGTLYQYADQARQSSLDGQDDVWDLCPAVRAPPVSGRVAKALSRTRPRASSVRLSCQFSFSSQLQKADFIYFSARARRSCTTLKWKRVSPHCWCAAPWAFFRRSISVLCSSFSVPISFRGARRRSDRRAETCTFYPHVKPRSFSPT